MSVRAAGASRTALPQPRSPSPMACHRKKHARMPVIICSSAFYHSVLLRLHAQAGGNSSVSLQGGDRGVRNFLGFDVLTSPYMPTASAAGAVCAFFGAFNAGCVLGDRTGIRLGRSDDFAFLNDLVTLKATSRYDMKIFDAFPTSLVPSVVEGRP